MLIALIAISTSFLSATAQEKWSSPELQQMYNNGLDYIKAGNYKDAIITFRQAILLEPGKSVLYQQLGDAYYLQEDYAMAEQTLAFATERFPADTQCYRLLAASQAAQNKYKKAVSTIEQGLKNFPASGDLYLILGNVYEQQQMPADALRAWTAGTEKAPDYAYNYKQVALARLEADNSAGGLIYAETYLDLQHDTTGDTSFKKKIFASYKKMFDYIASARIPMDNGNRRDVTTGTFEAAILKVYSQLTPVISDGITTENLVMVRTRFLMDWLTTYKNRYPSPLFTYLSDMVAGGHFEVYNEWLFGEAESRTEYDAWNKFHEGEMLRFLAWKAANPLRVTMP